MILNLVLRLELLSKGVIKGIFGFSFQSIMKMHLINKIILQKCYFAFGNNQIHHVWFVFSSCCNMAMTYFLFLQICLLDIVSPCAKKTIICVDNIFNLFYHYWNLFYYFIFWGKHTYKVFFLLIISLTFTSFIRSLIYDGS